MDAEDANLVAWDEYQHVAEDVDDFQQRQAWESQVRPHGWR
jgi:hypothetical protein